MNIKRKFVKQGINFIQTREFLKNELTNEYSYFKIQKTPLGTRVTIYSHKPGLIIGREGKKIKDITKKLEDDFGLENPQVDVQEIENPNLDAQIVANEIVRAIERGMNYRQICNSIMARTMNSGASGIEIIISGKLGSARGRTEKFLHGYIKHAGEIARKWVEEGRSTAFTKPGTIGVKVLISKLPRKVEESEEDAEVNVEIEETERPEKKESYEKILKGGVSEIKNKIKALNMDTTKLIEMERAGKNRKSLIRWLEKGV